MVQEESQREWIKGNARHITFIVTENCQLRCKYCYITGKNSIKKMSFDIAAKSVDMVLDMPQLVFGNEGVVCMLPERKVRMPLHPPPLWISRTKHFAS